VPASGDGANVTAKILFQFDVDSLASTFDAVVAIDSGVDHLVTRAGVTRDNVETLVHGAIFTRGIDQLHQTAIFVGGSDVAVAEQVTAKISECFFGPLRVSVLQDASGCNTTAAAAVIYAGKHIDYASSRVAVLAGTGPVGKRVAELVARLGGSVRLASRNLQRATEAANSVVERVTGADVEPFGIVNTSQSLDMLDQCDAVFACGASGVVLLDAATIAKAKSIKVAIDLNAVPPAGIEGIAAMDKAKLIEGIVCYGALGVGGLKMKIHRAAIKSLFSGNDRILDASEILQIGQSL